VNLDSKVLKVLKDVLEILAIQVNKDREVTLVDQALQVNLTDTPGKSHRYLCVTGR